VTCTSLLVLSVVMLCVSALPGCRTDTIEPVIPGLEAFNFMVTDSQLTYINSSRGIQYEVNSPVPELRFASEKYAIDRFEIRGDNTLNFTRKGFGVNMDRKIPFLDPVQKKTRKLEEFKLLAMVYDYTYIENSTAFGLFRKVNLWPLFDFYTEVQLSNKTQGLYHFIEDPFEYYIEQQGASCVLRRGYHHSVKSLSVSAESLRDSSYYVSRFNKIYTKLILYSGQKLLDSLSACLDLEKYFTKLSIDLLVKNGDYTDEVNFYTRKQGNNEVFCASPWDYDDLFMNQPHEIGRAWAVGTVFGKRSYNSMKEITDDVGNKLLFSVEDDLDYKIAKDSLMYQTYLKTLRSVMEKLTLPVIDQVFDETNETIGAFYANNAIIEQSRYDVNKTTYSLFTSNLADKRKMLKERRTWILQQLDLHQTK